MAYEIEKRTVDALNSPDKANGLGPTPQGYPVVLGDNTAYWFACVADPYGDDDPIGPLVEAAEAADKMARAYQESNCSMREYLAAMNKMSTISLSLQYTEQTVSDILTRHLVTAQHYDQIVSAVLGSGPGYEVEVKKKS